MHVSAKVERRSLRSLVDAIKIYERASSKDLADVVNHALKQVAIFWSHHMPMADRNKIRNELQKIVLSTRTAKGRLRKKAKRVKTPLPLAYAILLARAKAKGEKIAPNELKARANRMIGARVRSAGFNKAGIIPALRAFGAPLRNAGGAQQIGRPKGSASLATEARLRARLVNSVKTVGKIGQPALETAIVEAAADLQKYAEKKIADRTAKFNAGKPGG